MNETVIDTHGWALEDDGDTVLIRGPGNLEIVLWHFTPALLRGGPGPCNDGILLRQEELYYPLDADDRAEDPTGLHLIVTGAAGSAPLEREYWLHVGRHTTWRLPPEAGLAFLAYLTDRATTDR